MQVVRVVGAFGLSIVTLAGAGVAIHACGAPYDICDPVHYDNGTSNPAWYDNCLVLDDAGCCPSGFFTDGPDDPYPNPIHCIMPGGAYGNGSGRQCVSAPADAGSGEGGGGQDASDDGPIGSSDTCTGQCLPIAPDTWNGPELLWFGPPSDAPPCPVGAPTLTNHGYDDPQA